MSKPNYLSYPVIDAIDLRPFDNRLPDYGVSAYIENLGFVPQVITLLENSIEQIHSHNGVIDNATVPYLWCAERAMPGGNVWSKRQLYGLVEAVHNTGAKFFMGVLGAPNKFAEYNTKAEWLYAHKEFDIFAVHRNGKSASEFRGNINPLRHLPDGRLYEDVFIEDTLRYLDDYHMDGFYGGDGWCGLNIPLFDGDYHPDMIAQFEKATGIKVPGNTPPEYAAFLWDNLDNRPKWINFWADRWAAFYKKVHTAFHQKGKEFIVIDPWARGPVDALYDFGFDYEKAAPYLDALCLEAREENWGHRGGEWLYVWETGERVSIPAIRAKAPNLKLYWAACICNAPEHWQVMRDCAAAIERESLSLPLLSYVDDKGAYKRAFEGLHFIFGTDLTQKDWEFLRTRWDFSYGFDIERAIGPAVYYSEAVHQAHLSKGRRWELTAAALNLITAGLPVHSAVSDKNLKVANCDGYILVDPYGITDEEVRLLIEKQKQGAALVVVGGTDNELLLNTLGVRKTKEIEAEKISIGSAAAGSLKISLPDTISAPISEDIADYELTDAEMLVSLAGGKRVLVSIKQNTGMAVFVRRRHSWPVGFCRGRYFNDYKDFIANLPDTVDKFISDAITSACKSPARVDSGQLYAVKGRNQDYLHIGLGNMGNIFSNLVTVETSRTIAMYDDYWFKRHTSGGYILFDSKPNAVRVKVPLDGSVQLKLKLKGDN